MDELIKKIKMQLEIAISQNINVTEIRLNNSDYHYLFSRGLETICGIQLGVSDQLQHGEIVFFHDNNTTLYRWKF